MKNKKTKYLPIVALPFILSGCSGIKAPMVLGKENIPQAVDTIRKSGSPKRKSYQNTGYPSFRLSS